MKNNKGFTLVEIITVLVIMSILAAVAVPPMMGYYEDSLEQECDSKVAAVNKAFIRFEEQREGLDLRNITNDNLQQYLKDNEYIKVKSDGTLTSPCPSGGDYQWNGRKVVCVHHHEDQLDDNQTLGSSGRIEELYQALNDAHISTSNLDSGGLAYPGSYSEKLNDYLLSQGLDLKELGAKSWAIRNASSVNTYILWTDIDISTLSPTQVIPVYKYNFENYAAAKNTYSIWKASIKYSTSSLASGPASYNIINATISESNYGGNTVNKLNYNEVEPYYDILKSELGF